MNMNINMNTLITPYRKLMYGHVALWYFKEQ